MEIRCRATRPLPSLADMPADPLAGCAFMLDRREDHSPSLMVHSEPCRTPSVRFT